MTIEETKKAIEVMQGYVDGKDIESRIKGHANWFPRNCPDWDFGTCDYRIKPSPHYRPFESAEEVMEAIKEHGDWVKYEGDYYRIIAVTRATVYYGGVEEGESFYKAVANTFLDGTPFGKLVEE